ncbi:MAG TPA: peptidoglycan DD-metalloendopeptidase family protein [Pyrinomonadaceae bacterium]|nr:peptidoglycan DD-metalloendopeptidase family protein [Pyrinomonadaceae bacterium]
MTKQQTVPMQLPFAPMEWWAVIQGNNNTAGTHNGLNRFAYDFARVNGSSGGAPVFATAKGKIVDINDSHPSVGKQGVTNGIKIEHAAGEVCVPIHIKQGSSTFLGLKVGDTVQMGQQIASVGDTGTEIGNFHLHIALSNEPIPTPATYDTMPSQFMDYDVSTDGGKTFSYVKSGTPQEGQWVRRRSLWSAWTPQGGGIIDEPGAFSRQPTITDVFAKGLDNKLWQKSYSGGSGWTGWSPHNDGFILGSSPVVDSMGPDHVHLFARGQDGQLWQKWWTAAGGWGNWTPLGGGIIGAPGVRSRQSTITDVFARGLDNKLWQKSYVGGTGWTGWNPHNDGFILGSSPVADSMGPDHVHLFARGQDGALWQKWWTAAGGWSGWNPLGGGIIGAPGVRSRQSTITDVFAKGLDGKLWQKSYVGGSGWTGWNPHDDGFVLGSSPVADSMGPNHVHLFARGEDGQLWQKWWWHA